MDTFASHLCSTLIHVDGAIARRTAVGTNSRTVLGSALVASGKATWSVKILDKPAIIGVGTERTNLEKWAGANNESWGFDVGDGQKAHGGWSSYTRVRAAVGSVVQVEVDLRAGTLQFAVGGRPCGVAFRGIRGVAVRLAVSLKVGGGAQIVSYASTGRAAAASSASAATAPGSVAAVDRWGRHSTTVSLERGSRTAHRTGAGSNSRIAMGSTAVSSGTATWVLEGDGPFLAGVCTSAVGLEGWLGNDANGWGYDGSDGQKAHNGSWASYGARFSREVTIQLDMDSRKLSYTVNGRFQGIAFTIPRTIPSLHVAVALSQHRHVEIKSFTRSGVHTGAATTHPTAASLAPVADLAPMSASSDTWEAHSATVQLERGNSVAHRTRPGANSTMAVGRAAVSTGKASWRLSIIRGPCIVGIAAVGCDLERWCGATDKSWGFDGSDGQKCFVTWSRYSTGFSAGSEVTVALDLDAGTLRFSVDGTDRGEAFNNIRAAGGPYRVAVALGQGAQVALLGLATPVTPGSLGGGGRIIEGFQGRGGKCSSLINLLLPDTVERVEAGNNSRSVMGRHGFSSGRVTWTVKVLQGPLIVGVGRQEMDVEKWCGADRHGWGYDGSDGQKAHSGWSAFGRQYSTGDTVSVTADFRTHTSSNTVSFAVNGSSVGVAFRDLGGPVFLAVSLGQGKKAQVVGVEFTTPPAVVIPDSFGVAAAAAAAADIAAAATPALTPRGARPARGTDKFHPSHCSSTVRIKDEGYTATRTDPGSNSRCVLGQHAVSSGIAEWTVQMVDGPAIIGVATTGINVEQYLGVSRNGWGYDGSDGQKTNGSWQTYARRFAANDTVTVSLDATAGTLRFKVNGTDVGVAFTNLAGKTVHLAAALSVNCGVKILSSSFEGGATPAPAAAPVASVGAPTSAAPAPPSSPLTDLYDAAKVSSTIRVEDSGRKVHRHTAGSNSRLALGKFVLTGGRASWTMKMVGGAAIVGVALDSVNLENYLGHDPKGWGYDGSDGQKTNGRWQSYGRRFSDGDSVTIVCDVDRGTLEYSVGGSSLGVAFTNLRGRHVRVAVALSNGMGATLESVDLSAARGHGGTPVAAPATAPASAAEAALAAGATRTSIRRLPLEFDPLRTYDGITIDGAKATLSRAEPGHSRTAVSKRGYNSGRHAWNVVVDTPGVIVGAAVASSTVDSYLGAGGGYGYDGTDGQVAHSGSWSYFGSGFSPGDRVTVVVDFDHSTLEFFVNDAPHGVAARDLGTFGTVFPAVSLATRGNSARLAPATTMPAPATAVPRRASSLAAMVTPADEAKTAMDELLRGGTTRELDAAITKLTKIARSHRDLLSWETIVKVVHTKRESPSFAADQWTTDIAKSYGQLLRMVKFGK